MSETDKVAVYSYDPEGFDITAPGASMLRIGMVHNDQTRPLISLHSDGTVVCDSLLDASEAGRVLAESVSLAWGGQVRRIAELEAEVARQRGVIEAWKHIDDEREKLFGAIVQTIRQHAALKQEPESSSIVWLADQISVLVAEKVTS